MATSPAPQQPPTTPQPNWLTSLIASSDLITRVVQAVLVLGGTIASVRVSWDKSPWIFASSVTLALIAVAWAVVGSYLRRRKAKSVDLSSGPRSTSSYFRFLLPFEKGEMLLGRDQEVGSLLTLFRALEYRFGFLSGEAGAGKTSLLRARVVPELEKDGYAVVYAARTGGDPITSIKKALAIIAPQNENKTDVSLAETIDQARIALNGKSLVVIIDQFEEHFVVNKTRESRQAFESAIGEISEATQPTKFLFSLRKEFVDDLLDLSRVLPGLQTVRWRLPLRNFSPETALEVARRVSQSEKLRFSDELLETVITDLSRDQQVRPVEFQIVLTTLLSQSIFDLPLYRAAGGLPQLLLISSLKQLSRQTHE